SARIRRTTLPPRRAAAPGSPTPRSGPAPAPRSRRPARAGRRRAPRARASAGGAGRRAGLCDGAGGVRRCGWLRSGQRSGQSSPGGPSGARSPATPRSAAAPAPLRASHARRELADSTGLHTVVRPTDPHGAARPRRRRHGMGDKLGNKLAAEFLGTFWLVFGGCGSAVIAAAFPEVGIGLLGVAFAFGLTVLTMAYAVGHVSGGHFNPAVSVGLLVGGRFPGSDLPGYVIAQV